MADRVLFVDDETPVLDGYKRMLHREFDVDVAVGGEQGLATIENCGPYAVVISDMRMPGMNGAQFLAHVRQKAPETVRMLLTGFADLTVAKDAVNQGNILRFLTKPCEKEVLTSALNAGVVQYHLVTAEKELLEKTLMGSLKVLIDVLSAASPEAFGRSIRIARYVRYLVAMFDLPSPWRFDAAAMLSQLGCVTLDPLTIHEAFVGQFGSEEDEARFAAHPQVARKLLAHIPRLEPVAWMISQQLAREIPEFVSDVPVSSAKAIVSGAKILKLAVAFDCLRMRGFSAEDAIAALRDRRDEFGPTLIDVLGGMKLEGAGIESRKVPMAKLTSGMILQQEIRSGSGILIVTKGQEVTDALRIKLDNFSRAGSIDKEIMVLVPA